MRLAIFLTLFASPAFAAPLIEYATDAKGHTIVTVCQVNGNERVCTSAPYREPTRKSLMRDCLKRGGDAEGCKEEVEEALAQKREDEEWIKRRKACMKACVKGGYKRDECEPLMDSECSMDAESYKKLKNPEFVPEN